MHVFKVILNHADIFISELDLSAKKIAYSVRDKETGMLLEPHFKSILVLNDKQITFDHRHIDLQFAKYIQSVLNS